jgi:hypothetical protein
MLCVLEVVLRQNPVTGCRRIPRQLLVLFENVLGVPANLDVLRAVGFKRAVGVLLLRLAAVVRAAVTIAATLALHTFEVSHSSSRRPPWPGRP